MATEKDPLLLQQQAAANRPYNTASTTTVTMKVDDHEASSATRSLINDPPSLGAAYDDTPYSQKWEIVIAYSPFAPNENMTPEKRALQGIVIYFVMKLLKYDKELRVKPKA